MTPLSGVRIWLSGSIPNDKNLSITAQADQKERIHGFVKRLALDVFSLGGTIVHGWHPSFMQPLREAASEFQQSTGDRAPLALFVSRHFSEHPEKNGIDVSEWNGRCLEPVEETRKAIDTHRTDDSELRVISLSIMRQELASRCNAIVAIGGKWWSIAQQKSGVPEEIELASASQIPLFLIGGMGGAVQGLLDAKPELLRNCANGLSQEQNKALAAQSDPGTAVQQVVEQLKRLPLRAISGRKDRPFRILCLDGGGIRGAYTAAVLAYWEKALQLHEPGRPRLIDHFDLVSGTSTGGILAIGLALGMSAGEMQAFYEDKGEVIFGSGEGLNKWWHSFRHWFTSKFDQSALQQELFAAYSSSPVGKSGLPKTEWLNKPPCPLLIPAYNTLIDRPHLFRTPYGRFQHSDRGQDPVTVALATAAAPTYFSPVELRSTVASVTAVDGGVWANSPVSIAIAEAISEMQVAVDRIRVLSIGTTHTTQLTGEPMQLDGKTIGGFLKKFLPSSVGWIGDKVTEVVWPTTNVNGLLGWAGNIAGLLMKTQSQTSDLLGQQLIGDRYVRVDSASPYGELDDVTRIKHFTSLGQDAAKEAGTFARVQSLFLG